MRNLSKYPITVDEMRATLDKLAARFDKEVPPRYGDLTPTILRAASQRLVRIQFANEPERPGTGDER